MGREEKDPGEVPSVAGENTELIVDQSVAGDAWSILSPGLSVYDLQSMVSPKKLSRECDVSILMLELFTLSLLGCPTVQDDGHDDSLPKPASLLSHKLRTLVHL
jgi:hypothetical protein